MSKLVLLITTRTEVGHEIGEAWQQAGAAGVTFVEGYGLHRLQQASQSMEVLPGMMSLFEILRQQEQHNIIMLSVVDNDSLVDRIVEATEDVVGSLMEPNNGIIFVLDVERTVGVRNNSHD
jgi:nitrogen regulatory protein PII